MGPNDITWDDERQPDITWDDQPSFANVQSSSASIPFRQFSPAADSQEVENLGYAPIGRFFSSAGQSLARTGLEAGRALSMAGAGLVGAASLEYPGFEAPIAAAKDTLQDDAFKAAQVMKGWEQSIPADTNKAGSVVGGLLGGATTLGIGGIAQGQDVIDQGGTVPQAVAGTALGAGAAEAGLLTGQLGGALPARLALQGTASGLMGEGTRLIGNQVLPESMRREFDPVELALNVGAGLGGALFGGAHTDALEGKFGPEAQGAATAAQIMGDAEHANTPAEMVPPGRAENIQAEAPAAAAAEQVQPNQLFDFSPTEQTRRVRVGDSAISYTSDGDTGHVVLLQTQSKSRGNGSARAAMEKLTQDADTQGKALTLDVAPIDSRVDENRLVDFYRSLGFEDAGTTEAGNLRMTRKPPEVVQPEQTVEQNVPRPEITDASEQAESSPVARESVPEATPEVPGEDQSVQGDKGSTAAPPGEPPAQVGVSRAQVDKERIQRGLQGFEAPEREPMQQALDRAAEKTASDPLHAQALAQALIEKPRAISHDEIAVLAHDRVSLNNERKAAAAEHAEALKSGDTAAQEVAQAKVRSVDRLLSENDEALNLVRPHVGRALNMFKTLLADDYSQIHILNVAKAKKGGELAPAQEARLKALTDQAEVHQRRLDELEKANSDMREQMARMKPTSPKQKESSQTRFKSLAEQLRSIAKKDQLVDPNCLV